MLTVVVDVRRLAATSPHSGRAAWALAVSVVSIVLVIAALCYRFREPLGAALRPAAESCGGCCCRPREVQGWCRRAWWCCRRGGCEDGPALDLSGGDAYTEIGAVSVHGKAVAYF